MEQHDRMISANPERKRANLNELYESLQSKKNNIRHGRRSRQSSGDLAFTGSHVSIAKPRMAD